MPSTIPQHFVDEFAINVEHLAQRKGSKFRGTVKEKTFTGDECTFEYLGSLEAAKITSRHADTVISERPHSRRWVGKEDYSVAELYDWTDDHRVIVSLESEYVRGQAWAAGRKLDDILVAAFSADAKSDRTGSSTVSWSPQAFTGATGDFSQDQLKIEHDYTELGAIGNSGTGMSLKKLRAVRRIFGMKDIDRDQNWYVAMTPTQEQDLLIDSDLTTVDRMNLKAYLNGEMPDFYGFKFVKTTALTATGGQRQCWAYTQRAMGLGVGREVRTEMDRRPDKNNHLQILTTFSFGASRLIEDEVVEIECEDVTAAS